MLYDQSALPVLSLAAVELGHRPTEFIKRKHRTAQRFTERSMFSYARKDRKKSDNVVAITKLINVINNLITRILSLRSAYECG